jgi:predicted glycosyltransferase involved in capsule biosynthesis
MNRIEFLKKTIHDNLEIIEKYNKKYQGIHQFELSLCNYDSKDGLDKYVRKKLQKYIDKKLLIYTKSDDHGYFNPGRAKNIAHKQSNGNILVNLDADNFILPEFMEYIIDLFTKNVNIITVGQFCEDDGGGYGRVCLSRENFYKLGGYYENFKNYGYEDDDLYNRGRKYLHLQGIEISLKYLKFLNHSNEKRTENMLSTILSLDKQVLFDKEINQKLSLFYINQNIMNPNEWEQIEFGKI